MIEVGGRVEFLGWGQHDPYTDLKVGTKGTVRFIDHAGTIHVDWDDGHTLGLVTQPLTPSFADGFRPDRFREIAGDDELVAAQAAASV